MQRNRLPDSLLYAIASVHPKRLAECIADGNDERLTERVCAGDAESVTEPLADQVLVVDRLVVVHQQRPPHALRDCIADGL